ncbi:MAG: hypothetical protein IIZ39_05340 [Blautia sp.]|nr:hypothetical protein [Blautia sp.]
MKKRLSIFCFVFVLTMLLCTPAFAKTVCKIGSKGYSSMLEAVNAVKDGQTITVTKAIKTSEPFSTFDAKAKKFTIDWKNKKYTYTGTEHAAFHISEGHTVTVKNLNVQSDYTLFSIANNASLTIKSGKVTTYQLLHSYGKVNISGGSFYTPSAERAPFIENRETGVLSITKGSFSGEKWLVMNLGKMTIKNGEFKKTSKTGDQSLIRSHGVSVIKGGAYESVAGAVITTSNDTAANFTISGGKFSAPNVVIENNSQMTISAGTFKSANYTSGPCVKGRDRSNTKIKGGTFIGGFNVTGKLTISGGKTNAEVIVGDKGDCTITKLTIKQDPSPGRGPGNGAMLVNQGGKFTVKGGKYVSKNGYGFSGKVDFEVSGDYKKLFTVKKMNP